jgi:hypothetical protein
MSTSALPEIPGGPSLIDWFGCVPGFHDANLLKIQLNSGGEGELRIHAWNMTRETDDKGYFILDKHAVVTFHLKGIRMIECFDFHMVPGIIFEFDVTKTNELFHIEWSSSYGVAGTIHAEEIAVRLQPGKPD